MSLPASQVSTTVPADPPPFDGRSVLMPGDFEATYPLKVRISGVCLQGMRNRLIPLRRIRWEDLSRRLVKGADGKVACAVRGMPTMYAIEYKQRLVRVWPAAINSFTLILQTGDDEEDVAAAEA